MRLTVDIILCFALFAIGSNTSSLNVRPFDNSYSRGPDDTHSAVNDTTLSPSIKQMAHVHQVYGSQYNRYRIRRTVAVEPAKVGNPIIKHQMSPSVKRMKLYLGKIVEALGHANMDYAAMF